MAYWVNHDDDPYIPSWLKSNLSSKCSYCGAPLMNYYNDDLRCTNRKCSNKNCYGFVAAKADFARKILGIKGIGFAGCLKDAQLVHATSPFQLFKLWGLKPKVTLSQFLRMHCFEGVDSEWERITKELNIFTLDELYERYDGKWKKLLLDNKDDIYANLEFVTMAERPSYVSNSGPERVFTIMITGTPNGYATKEHFIDTVNAACKGRIVVIHQKTKRQSGVDFLIREPGSTTKGKVDAAKRGGIPIVTSEQFIQYLIKVLNDLNTESK